MFRNKKEKSPKKFIYVTYQKEGIHAYKDAPQEVYFLRYPHRHMFHFKIYIEVFHDDRDLEFIMFKRELENLYWSEDDTHLTMKLDNKSCEMIADDIYRYLSEKYPGREIRIDISEDGENGCYIEYGNS